MFNFKPTEILRILLGVISWIIIKFGSKLNQLVSNMIEILFTIYSLKKFYLYFTVNINCKIFILICKKKFTYILISHLLPKWNFFVFIILYCSINLVHIFTEIIVFLFHLLINLVKKFYCQINV